MKKCGMSYDLQEDCAVCTAPAGLKRDVYKRGVLNVAGLAVQTFFNRPDMVQNTKPFIRLANLNRLRPSHATNQLARQGFNGFLTHSLTHFFSCFNYAALYFGAATPINFRLHQPIFYATQIHRAVAKKQFIAIPCPVFDKNFSRTAFFSQRFGSWEGPDHDLFCVMASAKKGDGKKGALRFGRAPEYRHLGETREPACFQIIPVIY